MEVRVAGHQVDTGESLREHAIGRMEGITEKYFSRAVGANVTFGRGPGAIVGRARPGDRIAASKSVPSGFTSNS